MGGGGFPEAGEELQDRSAGFLEVFGEGGSGSGGGGGSSFFGGSGGGKTDTEVPYGVLENVIGCLAVLVAKKRKEEAKNPQFLSFKRLLYASKTSFMSFAIKVKFDFSFSSSVSSVAAAANNPTSLSTHSTNLSNC